MPKMKTHKGAKKRIRISSKGKVRVGKAGAGHLMSHKSGGRCRTLRTPKIVKGAVAKRLKQAVKKA